MTAEELNQNYTQASWLIAKRSASVAGKALLFNNESSKGVTREIADIYGLSDEEVALFRVSDDKGAIASVQKTVQGLLSDRTDASPTMKVARSALKNGQAATTVAALLTAGPKAAQAAAAAGSHAASKGTPWGWIATAGYAVGSAGWFAYNARAFNLRIFEFVRDREGIEINAPPEEPLTPEVANETITIEFKLPTASAIAARTTLLTGKAGSAVKNVFSKLPGLRS